MVAAIFEAEMTREQADRLVGLMRENMGQRAPAVLGAMVLWEPTPTALPSPPHRLPSNGVTTERPAAFPGVTQLIAVWESREAWEGYLSSVEEPRTAEFIREVGAEPTLRVVPVLEWA